MIKYEEYLKLTDEQKCEYDWKFKEKRRPRSNSIQTFTTVVSLSIALCLIAIFTKAIVITTTEAVPEAVEKINFQLYAIILLVIGIVIMIIDLAFTTYYNNRLIKKEREWLLIVNAQNFKPIVEQPIIPKPTITEEPTVPRFEKPVIKTPSFAWTKE